MAEPPEHVLEEVLTKFIYSAPLESLANFEQLMFLVEHAWWYYEDCVLEKYTNLRHYANYNTFAHMLFHRCSILKEHVAELPSIIDRYREYKANIPVYGAILLDAALERVLLVRGYKSASGWGFPRGKVNHKESGIDCACREVLEETGLEIDSMVNAEDMIEATTDNKISQLFIVSGLDPDTAKFAPQMQKEIGAFAWHYLHELPSTMDEANRAYLSSGGCRHRFFNVQPFVRKLRAWVTARRKKLGLPPPPWQAGGHKPSVVNPISAPKEHIVLQPPPQQQPRARQALQTVLVQHPGELPVQQEPEQQQQQQQQLCGKPAPQQAPLQASSGAQQPSLAQPILNQPFSRPLQQQQQQPPQPQQQHPSEHPSVAPQDCSSAGRDGTGLPATPTRAPGVAANAVQQPLVKPNLVMSAEFRFDRAAILRCLG